MVGQQKFVRQVPDWFPTRKAAQVAAFFASKAGGRIKILHATKMIYLADRLSLQERDYAITGDDFVSMRFGPVNTYTYSYMKGEAPSRSDQWAEFIARRVGDDISLSKPVEPETDLDELSRSDLRILNQTWEAYREIDRFALAEWTHDFCPEWQDPNGSSIPIEFSTVFAALQKAEPAALAEEIRAHRHFVMSMAG